MKIGFIGLGTLGKTIAKRLEEQGRELVLWNRTPGKNEGLAGTVAASPKKVADETEMIFLCLFDSDGVDEVLNERNGVLDGSVRGKIVIDLTTNHYARTPDFHEACKKLGASYLEAPVLGSVAPASQGALTVLVSGEEAAYKRAEPLLGDIGKTLFFLKTPGLAAKMKLVNNLCLGSFMATIAEALSLGETAGTDKETVLDILAAGAGNSMVLNAKRQKLLEGDFAPHFSSALIYKDLHCLQDLAYDLKHPLVTGSAVKELFGRTYPAGKADEDFAGVYQVVKG